MLKNFETALSQLMKGVDWTKPKFDGFRSDQHVAKVAVILAPSNIEHVDKSLLDNKDFMLSCVKISPSLIRFASDRLKDDAELHIVALQESNDETLFWEHSGQILSGLVKGKDKLELALQAVKQHKLVDLVRTENSRGEARPKIHRKIGEYSFSI